MFKLTHIQPLNVLSDDINQNTKTLKLHELYIFNQHILCVF